MTAFAKQAHGTLVEEAMPMGGQAVRIRISTKPESANEGEMSQVSAS